MQKFVDVWSFCVNSSNILHSLFVRVEMEYRSVWTFLFLPSCVLGTCALFVVVLSLVTIVADVCVLVVYSPMRLDCLFSSFSLLFLLCR